MRSEKGIVDWVGENFIHAFPDTPDINRGAVPYNPSVAVKAKEKAASGLLFHGIVSKEKDAYDAMKLNRSPIYVKPFSKHPQQSIAILVATAVLWHIVPPLKVPNCTGMLWI